MWTTYANINEWFDAWELFLASHGFVDKNADREVTFTKKQKRHIINVEETISVWMALMVAVVDALLANMITIKNTSRPGTGQNKSGVSSMLTLGSNAARESMPIHIMFASKAAEECNYAVNPEWILGFPSVIGQFGHTEEKSFTASTTVNTKGGTDAHVLEQYLMHVLNKVYPNAPVTPGNRVIFKIDGGPGCLDIKSLAELCIKRCYLFPGVQNTMHITQETDQNYGKFKSYRREQQQREQSENQENLPPLEQPKVAQKIMVLS
jgi:hypothetical protein